MFPTCWLTLALSLAQLGASKAMGGRFTMPIFTAKQQQTASQSGTTNSSLWTTTTIFSTAEAIDHCTHWLSVDHMSDERHKNSRSKKLLDEDGGPSMSRTQARHVVQPVCKSWNYSHCVSATCAYRHVCLECRENHRIVQCPCQWALLAISERSKGNGPQL